MSKFGQSNENYTSVKSEAALTLSLTCACDCPFLPALAFTQNYQFVREAAVTHAFAPLQEY